METPRDRKEDCECEPEEQKVIRPQGQMTKATDDFRHNPQEPHRVQDTQREAYVHSPVGGWQWAKRRLEQTSRIFHKPGLEWHMESTKQPGQRDRLSVTVGLTKGLHTRWLGRMPRNNPLGSLSVALSNSHPFKARPGLLPGGHNQGFRPNRLCSVTDTAWGPQHTRKGGDGCFLPGGLVGERRMRSGLRRWG